MMISSINSTSLISSKNKIHQHNIKKTRIHSIDATSGPKSGTIGKERCLFYYLKQHLITNTLCHRFEQDAITGTYFSKESSSGDKVIVKFETGSKPIVIFH